MSTFAGAYLTEPIDLRSICSESDIIATCDDAGLARDITAWADLADPELAAIVAVMDEIIAGVESTINSYARTRGYAIPLSPVDDLIVKLAARLAWVDMRQRAKGLTAEAAEELRKTLRSDLRDIEAGRITLTAALDTTTTPAGALVYAITDAATRDTDATTPRMSRKSMEGW